MNFKIEYFLHYSTSLLLKINRDCQDEIYNLFDLAQFDYKNNRFVYSDSQQIYLTKIRKFKRLLTKELRNRSDKQNDLNWVTKFFNVHSPFNQNCYFKNDVCLICNRIKGAYEN